MNKRTAIIILIIALLIPDVLFGTHALRQRLNTRNIVNKATKGDFNSTSSDVAYFPSPDKKYVVIVNKEPTTQSNVVNVVTPQDGKLKRAIITKEMSDKVGLTAIPVSYNITFSKWIDNTVAQFLATYKNGQKYTFNVNISTLEADTTSFKVVN